MVEIHREPQSTLPSPGQKQPNPQETGRPVEWVQATTPPAEAHPPRGDSHPATFRAPPTPRGSRRGGSYVQPRRPKSLRRKHPVGLRTNTLPSGLAPTCSHGHLPDPRTTGGRKRGRVSQTQTQGTGEDTLAYETCPSNVGGQREPACSLRSGGG